MVGATEIVNYLTHLLPVHFNELDLQLIFSNKLLEFIVQPVVQRGKPLFFSNSPPALDYKLRDYGSVIPQSILTPATPGDALRYDDVSLEMPIFFVHANHKTLGLRLKRAEAGDSAGLLHAHALNLVLVENSNSDKSYLDEYSSKTRICVRVSVSPSRSSRSYCTNGVHF